MDLLSSPQISDLLQDIRKTYGNIGAVGSKQLDRFFWLHAARTGSGPLNIWPNGPDAPAPKNQKVRLCNLILQGGGTLGLAHAGFVTGLEAAGVRFVGLAGTSAGSILAMGIAAIRGKDVTRATYRELVAITDAVPMDSFIDGPRPLRILIKHALNGKPVYAPKYWPGILAAVRRLKDRRGLNHGSAFEIWFESVIKEHNCETIDALYECLDAVWADLADLRKLRMDGSDREAVLQSPEQLDIAFEGRPGTALLQLITMAMPVGLKFKLPQDLYYLSPEYQKSSPARLVRTSMSIPAFFEPVVMRTNSETWPMRVAAEVADLVSGQRAEAFKSLDELVFLDGGMISNLPNDSFRDIMPEVPTVVVPLVKGGSAKPITRRNRLKDLATDVGACVSAIRLQRDRETWAQNSALRMLFDEKERNANDVMSGARLARTYPVAIAPIETGDANWLNFVMSAQDKAALFEAGLRRARELLKNLSDGTAQ